METILPCQELVLSQIPGVQLPDFVIIPKQGHGLLEERAQPGWEAAGRGAAVLLEKHFLLIFSGYF